MCCARHARDIRVAFPSLSQAARSLWCLLQGLVRTGQDQGTGCWSSPEDVRGTLLSGHAGAEPAQTLPLSLLPKGGGWRGRQPIWRSQSQCWQYFKVWYILSLPGICMDFLSSACYEESVKI